MKEHIVHVVGKDYSLYEQKIFEAELKRLYDMVFHEMEDCIAAEQEADEDSKLSCIVRREACGAVCAMIRQY